MGRVCGADENTTVGRTSTWCLGEGHMHADVCRLPLRRGLDREDDVAAVMGKQPRRKENTGGGALHL